MLMWQRVLLQTLLRQLLMRTHWQRSLHQRLTLLLRLQMLRHHTLLLETQLLLHHMHKSLLALLQLRHQLLMLQRLLQVLRHLPL
jgi:hypothetical protein